MKTISKMITMFTLTTGTVLAFGGPDPADAQFSFNLKQSANDAAIVILKDCVTTGSIGLNSKTVEFSASTKSNRKAKYLAVQLFVWRNDTLLQKKPESTPYEQRSSSGFSSLGVSFKKDVLCIDLDKVEISSWHKGQPLDSDPNPGNSADWVFEKSKSNAGI
jgi:hypothetical protein